MLADRNISWDQIGLEEKILLWVLWRILLNAGEGKNGLDLLRSQQKIIGGHYG